jgi:TPP-dependent pyruvate/acetoin dehydrogenase alpha subunit
VASETGNAQAYSHFCEKLRAAFHNPFQFQENPIGMAGTSTGGSLIDDAKLKQLYATMLQCRLLTERARPLRRDKRLSDASLGQEAIAVGCAIDLRPQDTVAVASHDSIVSLVKGVALSEVVAHARGNSAGGRTNIITSSDWGELFQAAGKAALAKQRDNKGNVVMVFTGVAATASGDWHQALRVAARRGLPVIFVVENNPWVEPAARARNGISKLPLKTQMDGVTSITVDGNDVVAVYRVAYESLERVRRGGGAVLIEAKPYRQHRQALLHGERDPLTHMEQYLAAKKLFTKSWKKQLTQEFSRELNAVTRKLEG